MPILDKFTLEREEYIAEYQTQAKFYRHNATGAKVALLENDDENKVFGVSFRTPVADSTGVPHILEHSVLAGSKKYPTKEPFVDLLKGSLYTFLNAFTYPDRTCYPVASQNSKDFYNLIDVYLDAVFRPLLDEKTFAQEGWHYELKNLEDPLTIKGVVYNEMKGVYSDPENLLVDTLMAGLFPNTSYRHDSGGNPDAIPTLTYEQFKDFHARYYHPSNAYFYFYGNDHSPKRLEKIDEVLQGFTKQPVNSRVSKQAPLKDIAFIQKQFDPGENNQGGYLAKAWLLQESNPLELSILTDLLLGNSEAPLYKALIESELGDDLTPSGFETFGIQPFFMVGLKHVLPSNYSKVSRLIQTTLEEIVSTGFAPEKIEASLNSTEFALRELNTGSQPRGLVLMTEMLKNWVYDRDPLQEIRFEEDFKILKEHLRQNPRYLSNVLKTAVLENPHHVTLELSPQPGLNEHNHKTLEKNLAKQKAAFSNEEIERIQEETAALITHQGKPDTPEAKAKIPKLEKADLEGRVEKIETRINQLSSKQKIFTYILPTNDISYVDLGFDLRHLTSEEYAYLPLLQRALKEFDTATSINAELTTVLDTHTGNFHTNILNTLDTTGELKSYFFVHGKALGPKLSIWLKTVREILTETIYDRPKKITQFLKDETASFEAGFLNGGQSLALSHLRASLDVSEYLDDQVSGVGQFKQLKVWKTNGKIEEIIAKLTQLSQKIFQTEGAVVNLTTTENYAAEQTKQLQDFLADFTQTKNLPTKHGTLNPGSDTAFVVPTKVNYNCLAAPLSLPNVESAAVVLKYLNLDYLWNKIRVIGGAYGTRAGYARLSKIFTIMSYRDPRTVETYTDYERLSEYLQKPLDEEALLQAITGAIGSFDAYRLPHQKGYFAFYNQLIGRTHADLEKTRAGILETSAKDFQEFGRALQEALPAARRASVTNEQGATALGFKTEAI